jgi:hypothetical protein
LQRISLTKKIKLLLLANIKECPKISLLALDNYLKRLNLNIQIKSHRGIFQQLKTGAEISINKMDGCKQPN